MRLVAAVAGLLFAAAPASAQYYGPRPAVPIGPPSAYDVAEIVQAMGLDPIGPPGRSGAFFVQRARDDFGRVLNVTVDARRSQVIAIEATARPPQMHAGYEPYGGPYARAPYGRYPFYGAASGYDEGALTPPGSITASRAQPPYAQPMPGPALPPQTLAPHKPAVKSAALPQQRAPLPRKRPAAAPQETAGTVEPAPSQNAAPQGARPQNSAPNPPVNAAPKPQDGAMPPVAPLE